MPHHHKSGPLKQQNKKHHTLGHRSKAGARRAAGASGGRVDLSLANPKSGVKSKNLRGFRESVKDKRRQATSQRIQDDRRAAAEQGRQRRRLPPAPRIVAALALTDNADVAAALAAVEAVSNEANGPGKGSSGGRTGSRVTLMAVDVAADDLNVLHAAQVADVVMLVLHAGEPVMERGVHALRLLKAQGSPPLVAVLTTGGQTLNAQARGGFRADAQRWLKSHFGTGGGGGGGATEKPPSVVMLDGSINSARMLARSMLDAPLRPPRWRVGRAYAAADSWAWVTDAQSTPAASSSGGAASAPLLRITGYVRGGPMSASACFNIPGVGTFHCRRIEAVADSPSGDNKAMDESASAAVTVLDEADPSLREPLEKEFRAHGADVNYLDQTWPANDAAMDDDGAAAGDQQHQRQQQQQQQTVGGAYEPIVAAAQPQRKKKLVPRGTSAYQAAWIIESDDEEGSFEDDDDPLDVDRDGGGDFDEESLVEAPERDDEDDGLGDDSSNASMGHTECGGEEAGEEESETSRLKREESDEVLWPDEIEIRPGERARETYREFQGLQSFRNSKWDHRVGVPPQYGAIYQFRSMKASRARAEREAAHWPVPEHTHVHLYLEGVPASLVEPLMQRGQLTAWALWPHENKLSVLHFQVLRPNPPLAAGKRGGGKGNGPGGDNDDDDDDLDDDTDENGNDPGRYKLPVPNGSELEFVVGSRRFSTRAMFSDNNPNNDKHKVERFLHKGRSTIVSIYSPVQFGPCPVLLFSRSATGQRQLVASGSLLAVDPRRVMLLRAVMTGRPVKVHRNRAVVKGMFYDPDDIRWFKTIELWSKYGRTGHIREPLGTHGRMKVDMDGRITQQDTICLSIYHREFPPWMGGPNQNWPQGM